jgi:hypothetical protein
MREPPPAGRICSDSTSLRGLSACDVGFVATSPCHGLTVVSVVVSCVPINPAMTFLLEALRAWPLSAHVLEELRAMPEWDEARAWGWIMASGELTGTGARHAGNPRPGLIR